MHSNKVTFEFIEDSPVDFSNYGFSRVSAKELLFSYKKITSKANVKKFYQKNFEAVSKLYYKAYELDTTESLSRKNRLLNILKSIDDQTHMDVPLLIIYALKEFMNKIDEQELVVKIIKEILPNAGFSKALTDKHRYVWSVNKNKKFKKGIGKAFVINYIKNKFDADMTYKWLKKVCYLKDGLWNYKSIKSKNEVEKYFEDFLKHGGICMEEKEIKDKDSEFEAFLPLGKEAVTTLLKTSSSEDGFPIIKGIASTTNVDREDERVSKNFIKQMKKTAKGLPITDNTHYVSSSKETIGVVTKSSGTKDTFEIEARLMKRADSQEVDFILKQIETGIKYGFSIGGRINKVYREFNEELQKEIYVLDEGDLYHITLTTQPANADTFAEAITKCISKKNKISKSVETDEERTITDYKHNSLLHKELEPEKVNIQAIPEMAFPKNRETGEVYKNYPHHFIDNGVMYLHKGMLESALQKAVQENADKLVITHLTNHLNVIGLSKKAAEITAIAEEIDRFEEVQDAAKELSVVLKAFFEEVKTFQNLGNAEKMKAVKKSINKFGDEVEMLISKIEKEEKND